MTKPTGAWSDQGSATPSNTVVAWSNRVRMMLDRDGRSRSSQMPGGHNSVRVSTASMS